MKARIRRYEPRDFETLVEAMAKYVPELPNYSGIEISREHMLFTMKNNYTNGAMIDCHVLVDEADNIIGGVGMYCVKVLFSEARMTNDIFLFILPEHRSLMNVMALIESYKKWAIARGAAIIQSTQTGGYKDVQMEKLAERAGFKAIGTIYRLMPEETRQ